MLTYVRRPDNREITFRYDALGRRIEKRSGHRVTQWVWDGNVPLHEIRESHTPSYSEERGSFDIIAKDPAITWVFEEGTFVPAAKIAGKEKLSIVSNYMGTPEAMYRDDGETVWTCELNSFGKVRNFKGQYKTECPFRYQGQYEDAETGLYYNRFRYYSPEEGMYLSQDPIRLNGGLNLYAYVEDTNGWIDEFGLQGDYHQMPRIPGYQRHHIIPQSMKHPLLDRLGFDVHQSRNIIQLPTSADVDPTRTVHLGPHNSDYDKLIKDQLDVIDALDASDDIKRMHLNDVMENVGDDLRNKRIKLNCN
jgi:RHS repeat-associated protein